MKTLLLSLLMTSPMGCGPTESAVNASGPSGGSVATTTPEAQVPQTQQASASTERTAQPEGGKKGSADSSGTVAAGSSEDPPKHRDNPRRLYQLDELKTVKIKIGKHSFTAWVMDNDQKRAEGMMWLEDQDFTEKDAMIFVYNEPFEMSFWMRNTLVDLDIAYVAPNKSILNIETMKRLDETGIRSKGQAQYAIEFKARLMKKLGIKAGMKVEMPNLKSENYR